MENHPNMLDFLKAMSDPDRLRIIGLLAKQNANAKDIAKRLKLPFREVINHLGFLCFVGIIIEREDCYEFSADQLETLALQEFSEQRQSFIVPEGTDRKTRLVLTTYLNPDGTIKQLPVQPSKLRILLEYLSQAFTAETPYTEKEVNIILAHFHEDISGLRRDLVDTGLLVRERDGSRYWRPEGVER